MERGRWPRREREREREAAQGRDKHEAITS
jgi:hypothetical protein